MRAHTPDEAKRIFYDIWKAAEREQSRARRRRFSLLTLQLAIIAGLCTLDFQGAVSAIHGFVATGWPRVYDK